MEQKQRLDYLVEKFKEDSGEYSDLAVPDSEPEKRRILRSLMNIRMPRHLDAEVQEVQDAFLQEGAIVNAANSQMLGCFVFGMMSPPCLLNESMK